MRGVFILLNRIEEYDFADLIEKHLKGIQVEVGTALPPGAEAYDLIVPWGYRKKIENASAYGNIVVMHSSDLPEGRGWAPIFNTIIQKKTNYVITAIIATDGIDEGPAIAKARFKMRTEYTAPVLRKWDSEISILIIKQIIERIDSGWVLSGLPQKGVPTYNPRRKQTENKVSTDKSITEIFDLLRAAESGHPVYFEQDGTEFELSLQHRKPVPFPSDLTFEFLT